MQRRNPFKIILEITQIVVMCIVAERISVIVGKADFIANGKAIGLDDYAGWAKLVCHAGTGVVLGGTVIGSEVSELLLEIALAVRLKLKAADIAMTIHAHPTLSEVLMDAALDAVSKLEK